MILVPASTHWFVQRRWWSTTESFPKYRTRFRLGARLILSQWGFFIVEEELVDETDNYGSDAYGDSVIGKMVYNHESHG